MIPFKKHILPNGLTLITHFDKSTPVTATSLIYKVGSRNEDPQMTGLAHLFEHLMFGGSKHIPDFDTPIQNAGGENNAFTNNDLTNFYCILPGENIDTALWLESDRMAALHLTEKKLKNQQKVVIEEFKETCLNEPYGDVWHHISELSYTQYPYKWPVIGSTFEHIQKVKLEDASAFYQRHYHPGNAILSIAGPLPFAKIEEKVNYWFGDIPTAEAPAPLASEETFMEGRVFREVKGDVPSEALYMAFPMCDRLSPEYYASDLISDILSGGRSSVLYQELVKQQELFTYIDAYITGTAGPGLFIIEGKLAPGKSLESGEAAVWAILESLQRKPISFKELYKLKNKVESTLSFSEISVMSKAINLAVFESLGDAGLINREVAMYRAITREEIHQVAQQLFRKNKVAVIYYKSL
jgi:zinc protease